jgi:hypothetical protein
MGRVDPGGVAFHERFHSPSASKSFQACCRSAFRRDAFPQGSNFRIVSPTEAGTQIVVLGRPYTSRRSSGYVRKEQSFHSPSASALLSLAWPRESRQREGHLTLAPCAQSLCSRYARQLRGSLTVHPWTGIELAHIVWAILRTIPTQPRRDRGGPLSAHRARQSEEQSQSVREPAPSWLRTMRSRWGPYAAAQRRRRGPKGGSQEREPVGCQSMDGLSDNPGAAARSRRAGCPETAVSGWPSLGLLSLGQARESDSLAGRRVIPRHGCRAPKDDCRDAGGRATQGAVAERAPRKQGYCAPASAQPSQSRACRRTGTTISREIVQNPSRIKRQTRS